MTQLSDLPVELLQRIAKFLSCSSALDLTRVSHKLHDACYDLHVFRDIALRFANWPDGLDILKNASISRTVRVAYAVERAARRADGKYGSAEIVKKTGVERIENSASDIENWLPQLLAWRHPICRSLHDASLLLSIHYQLAKRLETSAYDRAKKYQYQNRFVNFGFCIAYYALQSMTDFDDDVYAAFETEDYIMKMSSDYMLSACWGIRPPQGGFYQPTDIFDMAQGSACIVPMLYAIIGSGLFRRLPLPHPSKIKFSTFMDIPWVYNGSPEVFSTCHVEKMSDAAFLTGSWIGYYTDQRLLRHQHFALVDHPMTDISIVAQASEESSTESKIKGRIHCSTSSGYDLHGAFTICGEIYRNGQVHFTKRYVSQNWEWRYMGTVVPFGITGRWTDIDGNFGGHFWIWKQEWCNSHLI